MKSITDLCLSQLYPRQAAGERKHSCRHKLTSQSLIVLLPTKTLKTTLTLQCTSVNGKKVTRRQERLEILEVIQIRNPSFLLVN